MSRLACFSMLVLSACGEQFVDGSPDGGATARLVDDGLVVRYFIDEAQSGLPQQLLDSADSPLNLQMVHGAGLGFSDSDGHRALEWPQLGQSGRAQTPVDATKIHGRLDGSTQATIEVVVNLTQADPMVSRLLAISEDVNHGRLALTTDDGQEVMLQLNNEDVGAWNASLAGAGRVVVHAVLATERPNADQRARLFVNGQELTHHGTLRAGEAVPLQLEQGRWLVLGNRAIGDRSFIGKLYYAALYSSALDDAAVQANAARLLDSDDSL